MGSLEWLSDMNGHLDETRVGIDLGVFGWTARLLAARTWQHTVVSYLAEHGADVDARDSHRRSALHWSCSHGDKVLAQQLVCWRAAINAEDHCGQSALHWAVVSGHVHIANMLLRRHAAANKATSDCATPLHLATYKGKPDAVTMLLTAEQRQARRRNQSVSDTAREDKNFTALEMADLVGNWQIAQLLKGRDGSDESEHSDSNEPRDGADERTYRSDHTEGKPGNPGYATDRCGTKTAVDSGKLDLLRWRCTRTKNKTLKKAYQIIGKNDHETSSPPMAG